MKLFSLLLGFGAVCGELSSRAPVKLGAALLAEAAPLAEAIVEARELKDGVGEVLAMSGTDLESRIVKPLGTKLGWQTQMEGDKVVLTEKGAEGDVKLLEVKFVETAPGKRAIELSNTNPTDFPAFVNNHALYSRGILKADTVDKISKYVEEKLKLFQLAARSSKPKTVVQICEDLRALSAESAKFDVSLMQPKPHFCVIEVRRRGGDPNFATNPIVCHIRVHNINEEMVGINVVQTDREYEGKVPKHNYDENVKDVKNVIREILNQTTNLPITIQTALKHFATAFSSHCGGKRPGLRNLVTEGEIYGATLEETLDCAFKGAKIFLEQFNYGYLQYLHVVIDHALLRAEYMVGIDPKVFEANLKSVLAELNSELTIISKLRTDSKQDYKVTLEDIETALKESMEGCEVKKEETKVTVMQGETEVARAVKAAEGSYYIISFFTPFGKKPKGASNPELFIEEENGFDQLLRLREHAKKFIDDIKLV